MWSGAGFLASVCWGFYFATADKDIPIGPIVYALTVLTQPVVPVVLHFEPHYPLGVRAVVIANAATYALVGLIVEVIGRHSRLVQISN